VYDYDQDGVLGQVAFRALLRRLQVNWSAKQFVRVTRGALSGFFGNRSDNSSSINDNAGGGVWPDFDVDDFIALLAVTSAHMVDSRAAKKSGQAGRRVANHHAKILYSHFAVVWDVSEPKKHSDVKSNSPVSLHS
jgi:hypothetical protein